MAHGHSEHEEHGKEQIQGHAHGHGHGHARTTASIRALTVALLLTASFMVVEVVGGFVSGSLALLADAGHMLADAGALALALFAQRWAIRPRTHGSTFGFRRAEVIAAFVNGIALALTAVLVIKEAVQRWMAPTAINASVMLGVAAGGLLVNVIVGFVLMRVQRESLNVRAAFAHVATDAVGSVAALIAGLCVMFFDLRRADPALGVLIAFLVAYSGWRVLRETTAILLESAPSHLSVRSIEHAIRACEGVHEVHDLHVWRISDEFDALTVHVTLARGAHGVEVCRRVADKLKADFGLDHVTIQPEAQAPDQMVNVRASRDGAVIRSTG